MKYDEQTAAWAAMNLLAGKAPYEIAARLGGNSAGLSAMMVRFCGTSDPWRLSPLWGTEALALLKPAIAAYCDKNGIAVGDPMRPGRPLVPPKPPKPKAVKPPTPPDTSEYGLAKTEYLAALERLKAAKARRQQQE